MTDFKKFFSLPKDDRWLPSPYEIGGRSTDLSQLGWTLYGNIKEIYPINQVPPKILAALKEMQDALELGERQIEAVIEMVSEDRSESNRR